jgi:uncharacterized membrane protein YhaH (DUF805 family)
MTFVESIQSCFSKYANFQGRASRSEYGWFTLFVILGALVLSAFNTTLANLFCLATLLPSVAAASRRLHDVDRSGWIQLIGLVPIFGWLVIIYFLAQEGKGENRFGAALAAFESN